MTHEPAQRQSREWTLSDCGEWIAVPGAGDDKYSRGVLGVVTGSDEYPGAAVLGVEAATRTGVGMVRYVGDDVPSRLVLERRPETVTAVGRVQAWLIGSGMDAAHRDPANAARLRAALADGVPCVVDAGALDLIAEEHAPVVITPHYRELARVLAGDAARASGGGAGAPSAEKIAADARGWARRAADATGATVLLKGHVTHVCAPGGEVIDVCTGPDAGWLATAGSGDALGGILGALLATHADRIAAEGHDALAALAATAAALHGAAGARASAARAGGPIAALDVAEHVATVVGDVLSAA
ncbi:ADP-dependent NAD(P)H-hydrate dehydratase [Humibacter ginsenosidimutans]|uniref:ADP-dependent (S)-NAD(P)H-hydrate dehydratase n=1 Tax=Humibacter ginsenosidimutans TaxID=2599293 RepID=A0A5B8M8V9_9MICO|nr:ADP/ATP-dependent (S)-NAD(P)H-hydrate dehydratase [Humibacter ginsenosidimutans]QDZ16494.1 NAD(P)H-hydrate dehydratase [Humibacter ginsenosidimutans]